MERIEDLNDMYFFAKIVDYGGYTAAAKALGVPVSSLSRRVSSLETQLGVRLLNRSTRSVSVSEAANPSPPRKRWTRPARSRMG
jgi:DNA-binding transcriptional LysR family regulator